MYLEAVQLAQAIEVLEYRYEVLRRLAQLLDNNQQINEAIALLDDYAVSPVTQSLRVCFS